MLSFHAGMLKKRATFMKKHVIKNTVGKAMNLSVTSVPVASSAFVSRGMPFNKG